MYIVYKEKPDDFKLKDGSFLMAIPCVEGFFILKSQSSDAKLAGWEDGVELDSITKTEETTGI